MASELMVWPKFQELPLKVVQEKAALITSEGSPIQELPGETWFAYCNRFAYEVSPSKLSKALAAHLEPCWEIVDLV